jgi:hypothetical protein
MTTQTTRADGGRSPMSTAPLAQERFLQLSEVLTGYDHAELWGTGMVTTYLGVLQSVVGQPLTGRLLTRWAEIEMRGRGDPPFIDQLLQDELLGDDALGPVARNLVVLWYTGEWMQLPADWREAHGANALDETRVISPESYVQGLVWDAIHTHPQGAKQPGYGSWALPPKDGAP